MTLKELLNKVEFDNVAPFIVQYYPDLAKCMAGFKMAFDGMRNTMPTNADCEKVKVEYCIEEGKEACLSAYHSDNADWETVVGREVVIDRNVSAPLEEIVAAILFDATFWGFTPEDREETFEEWQEDRTPPTNGNPYRLKWWHLTQREHDSKCRKEDIGKRTYTWVGDNPLTEKRMNRAKRKRAYRWAKRIDELERLANRWDLLEQIKDSMSESEFRFSCMTQPMGGFFHKWFDYNHLKCPLLDFKGIECEVTRLYDYSASNAGLAYIKELIEKYVNHLKSNAMVDLLWVRSSQQITEEHICDLFGGHFRQPMILCQGNISECRRTTLTIIQAFYP